MGRNKIGKCCNENGDERQNERQRKLKKKRRKVKEDSVMSDRRRGCKGTVEWRCGAELGEAEARILLTKARGKV